MVLSRRSFPSGRSARPIAALPSSRILDLPCARKEQAKDVLADAVLAFGKDIGIDMNFASLVPDPALYESKMEELAYLAYED